MNIFWACLLLAVGLVILWKSADLLVDGAVGLAKRLGISPLIIGLTVVAMGTSAPEVAASVVAAVRKMGDMAIGNVYGSNIANLALVGGLAALIRPIAIKRRTLRGELPVMLLVALLLWPFLHNLYLSRPEGIILLGIFVVLILLTVYTARREAEGIKRDTRYEIPAASSCPQLSVAGGHRCDGSRRGKRDTKKCVLFVVIGLVGLALGAELTVIGAVFIGEQAGLSKAVIGLTIIAIGTSLPELATCLMAAIKGQHDISIGNLVGSNIFNTLLVVGVAGVVRPFEVVKRLVGVDYWVMIGVSAGFVSAALIGRRIGRVKGIVLVGCYLGYIVYLLAYSR